MSPADEDREEGASTPEPQDELTPLVNRCRQQEPEAIRELCDLYRERLKRYVETHMSNKGLARTTPDDVVQDALMVITQKLPELEYRGRQAFESWMLQICEGKIRDWIRHLGAAKRDVDREQVLSPGEDSGSDPIRLLASGGDSPSRRVYTGEKGEVVLTILAKLSDRHAKVLRLRHLEGLTFSEIGERMSISEDAAKALYGRAAVRFRKAAEGQRAVKDFTEFL